MHVSTNYTELYIFVNVFRSECSNPFLQIAEEVLMFHVIYTREHVYNYAWWLLLFYACLSGTNSSMNVLHFHRIL